MQWAGVGMWMVLGLSACSPTKTEIGNLNVIPPAPRSKVKAFKPTLFVINPQTGIVYPEGNEKLQRTAEFLASYIKEAQRLLSGQQLSTARKNSIIYFGDLKRFPLPTRGVSTGEVTSENIHLNGGSESGVFYGIQTLSRLCR